MDFVTPEAYIKKVSQFIAKNTKRATLNNFQPSIPESPDEASSILHLATKLNSTKALKTIVCSKSVTKEVLNHINDQGLTPLYLAIELGNLEAALILLCGGADPFIKSSVQECYESRYGRNNAYVHKSYYDYDIEISKLLEKHIRKFRMELPEIDKLIYLNLTDFKIETFKTIETMQLKLKIKMENFQLLLNALPFDNIGNPNVSLFEIEALDEVRSKFNAQLLKLQSYDIK